MRAITAPTVAGHPIFLRPLDPSDAEAWFEFVGDQQIMQHTSSNLRTVEDARLIIERANSAEPGTPIQFAVCAQDGRLIGSAGFHTISLLNRTAEVSYELHPLFWGKGIASAVCASTSAWGLAEQGSVRIQATVLEQNLASLRVLQRSGFQLEGKLRNFRIVRDEPRDYLLYSLVPPAALKS